MSSGTGSGWSTANLTMTLNWGIMSKIGRIGPWIKMLKTPVNSIWFINPNGQWFIKAFSCMLREKPWESKGILWEILKTHSQFWKLQVNRKWILTNRKLASVTLESVWYGQIGPQCSRDTHAHISKCTISNSPSTVLSDSWVVNETGFSYFPPGNRKLTLWLHPLASLSMQVTEKSQGKDTGS